jgi:hypothetical protein
MKCRNVSGLPPKGQPTSVPWSHHHRQRPLLISRGSQWELSGGCIFTNTVHILIPPPTSERLHISAAFPLEDFGDLCNQAHGPLGSLSAAEDKKSRKFHIFVQHYCHHDGATLASFSSALFFAISIFWIDTVCIYWKPIHFLPSIIPYQRPTVGSMVQPLAYRRCMAPKNVLRVLWRL